MEKKGEKNPKKNPKSKIFQKDLMFYNFFQITKKITKVFLYKKSPNNFKFKRIILTRNQVYSPRFQLKYGLMIYKILTWCNRIEILMLGLYKPLLLNKKKSKNKIYNRL